MYAKYVTFEKYLKVEKEGKRRREEGRGGNLDKSVFTDSFLKRIL